MRIAVVDIGTNSTRLLIADTGPGETLTELERHSIVTRLGQGVDHSGTLQPEAIERVFAALAAYRERIDAQDVQAVTAVLTSAVRDARNGAAFAAEVNARFALGARTITGQEEAALTFRGATGGRADDPRRVVVIDVGGGSTELVCGVPGGPVDFHVSTQAGVVRQTERFLRRDPPDPDELQALSAEAQEIFTGAVPEPVRAGVQAAIAVAGTATSCASILQELDPYHPARVDGYVVLLAECDMLLARLAQMTEAARREVTGLHPDRAPTIVAGLILLIEALRAFGLEEFEVSEQDILRGAALALAAASGG
ncbi:Ppx/GppA family phosphatase [Baekduia soli]|uniref:Ppx/GppA family phosphatase n=1 Tax=Baekduia soli TaxID=496014 RepID=A0A5B8U3A0_9ACTN|nr:Ppx/GppA phosphatase family protein [Baekduia soli]QEC47524.1 Ppx/GppA family phosphatase [Baekduia soli]